MEETSLSSLYRTSARLVGQTTTTFHRYLYNQMKWANRLTAIKGARGVGKTTMMLQNIKERFSNIVNLIIIGRIVWRFARFDYLQSVGLHPQSQQGVGNGVETFLTCEQVVFKELFRCGLYSTWRQIIQKK
jgi:hypothetical protein